MPTKQNKFRISESGFTLIELLIVVAIIAVLVGAGSVSFTSARKQGRDAQRLDDLQEIRSALEQYFAENGRYPIDPAPTPTGPCNGYCKSSYAQPWIPGLEDYFSDQKIPVDPTNIGPPSGNFVYAYHSANNNQAYLLIAQFEGKNPNVPKTVDGNYSISRWGGGGIITYPNVEFNDCDDWTTGSPPDPKDCVMYTDPGTQK